MAKLRMATWINAVNGWSTAGGVTLHLPAAPSRWRGPPTWTNLSIIGSSTPPCWWWCIQCANDDWYWKMMADSFVKIIFRHHMAWATMLSSGCLINAFWSSTWTHCCESGSRWPVQSSELINAYNILEWVFWSIIGYKCFVQTCDLHKAVIARDAYKALRQPFFLEWHFRPNQLNIAKPIEIEPVKWAKTAKLAATLNQ